MRKFREGKGYYVKSCELKGSAVISSYAQYWKSFNQIWGTLSQHVVEGPKIFFKFFSQVLMEKSIASEEFLWIIKMRFSCCADDKNAQWLSSNRWRNCCLMEIPYSILANKKRRERERWENGDERLVEVEKIDGILMNWRKWAHFLDMEIDRRKICF